MQRHFGLELLLRLVDEKDAERPVIDDAFGEDRDAAQQLVEIENFGDLAGNLSERLQGIGVVAFLLEQARVRQRLRDVHAELRENLLVALGEGADTIAEQVQRAEHPLLVPQRYDELRVHSGYEAEISRVFVDVVDENRFLLRYRRPDDAFAHLEAEVQHHVEWITLCVRDLQFLPPLVEHVYGEHRERGQPSDQSGDAPKQLVEIENAGHLAAQLEERGNELLIVRA